MKQASDQSLVQWIKIGASVMPLVGISYIFGFWISLGGSSDMWFAFCFPPTLLLACMALVVYIGRGRTSPALQIALICSALAVGTFLIMITVQSALRVTLLEDMRSLGDGPTKEAARWAVRAMNETQLAFDIAWDVWISMATVAFSIGMLDRSCSLSLYDRWVGGFGVLAGITGLSINFWTFPTPPSTAGLPDPGMFFFIWFSLVGFPLIWLGFKRRDAILEHMRAG